MDLGQWQKKITTVVDKRRGKKPPERHLLKLMEEVGELAEAFNKDFDITDIEHEAADVLTALLAFCQSMDFSLDDARASKFKVLKKRWNL